MKEIGQKFRTWLFSCLIGGVFPIFFFLVGWWGSIGRVAEDKIFLAAFVGLLWGVLLNYLVLKRILAKLYTLPLWIMSLVYIFYSICIYGFFMGFPLFNVLLGIPAGLYMGIRNQTKGWYISSFTCLILLILCITTAILALSDKTFGKELQNMFNLSFTITRPMLISMILIGSVLLLACQYFLTSYYYQKPSTQE